MSDTVPSHRDEDQEGFNQKKEMNKMDECFSRITTY